MSTVVVNVAVTGMDEQDALLRAIISGLSSRMELHADIANFATLKTAEYLESDENHTTAAKLGATPTGFRRKSAARLQAEWDETAAIVRIPRNTGLGRAFHDVDILPKGGRKYLAIPADARTYGKVPRDFPEGTFKFGLAMENGQFRKALLFAADGKPGFYLIRKAHQKQDRDLLPSDDAFRALAREESIRYIQSLTERTAA